jgi:FkbM family methyltransferase
VIKKLVRSTFKALGLEVRKLKHSLPENTVKNTDSTMLTGLARAKKNGINPVTVLDVGAAQGNWTKDCMTIWPTANYCMVEPLEERKSVLESFIAKKPKLSYVSAALGKENGKVTFSVSKDLDGSGVSGAHSGGTDREVLVTSADTIVSEKGLKGPYLIKLDTHGFEIPILEGCKHILPQTSLLVIECYGIRIQPFSLLFWELCAWLDKQGFGLIDIVDIMRRPGDQAFWQCDAFFVRKDHPVFSKFNYN